MQTTTHTYRPAISPVAAPHQYQRRFGPNGPSCYGLKATTDKEFQPEVSVYRDSGEDFAELRVNLGLFTSADFKVRLTPAELREVAARLLDAAHDIETLPAAVLTQAAA